MLDSFSAISGQVLVYGLLPLLGLLVVLWLGLLIWRASGKQMPRAPEVKMRRSSSSRS